MSPAVVIDTDVFSYLYKADTRATLYAKHLTGVQPHLAFATVAELHRWAIVRGWGRPRIDRLRATIAKCEILHTDEPTVLEWARVMSLPGRPIAPGDAWIAAIAMRHGMPLVSHNRKHFDGIPGLVLISEG
ncbi:MAG: type II toxin-antitoxin system VapC family toxin [Tepidisphaeraceae bacterium]